MKKTFKVLGYLADAEQRFSAYNAQDDMDLNLGRSMEDEFALANAGSASATQPLKTPKPYQLTVSNSTGSNLTAVLFGLNKYLLDPNFGSDAGVTVEPSAANLSYLEVLQQSGQQPFETRLIRVSSDNATQVTQTLNVTITDATGQQFTDPIYTDPYVSAYQFQDTRADIPYRMIVNANTYITVTVLANTDVNFTFFPAVKVNITKGLEGENPRQFYGRPPVNLGGVQLPNV